jgi:hypothetical protein
MRSVTLQHVLARVVAGVSVLGATVDMRGRVIFPYILSMRSGLMLRAGVKGKSARIYA